MEVSISTVEERKKLTWFDQFPLDSEWKIDGRGTRLKAEISGLFLKVKRETIRSSINRAAVRVGERENLGLQSMGVSGDEMWGQGKETSLRCLPGFLYNISVINQNKSKKSNRFWRTDNTFN